MNLKWKGLAKWEGANAVNYIFIAAYLVFLMSNFAAALSTNAMIWFHDKPEPNPGVHDYRLCGTEPGNDSVNAFNSFCQLDIVYDFMKVLQYGF